MSRYRKIATVVVAATIPIAIAGCTSGSTRASTATAPATTSKPSAPPLNYPGRLLVENSSNNMYQLAADGTSTQIASGASNTTSLNQGGNGEIDTTLMSPDGTLMVDETNGTLIGPDTVTHLPNRTGPLTAASFSPDGRQLAYTTQNGQVAVYDIAARSGHLLFQAPCAQYTQQGGANNGATKTLCGEANGVVWLDQATLFVNHFTGQLPTESNGQLPTTSGGYFDANTYSVVTSSGRTVTDVNLGSNATGPESGMPIAANGNTVVFDSGDWASISAIRTGQATVGSLPSGWEKTSLSPDGTMVAVGGAGPTWELVNIRTGAAQVLSTPDTPSPNSGWGTLNDDPFAWSPDGKFFAVQTDNVFGAVQTDNVYVVPVSGAKGEVVGQALGNITLVGWTP